MNRRQFTLGGLCALAHAEDAAGPATMVFKHAAGCAIQADIYTSAGPRRPVAVLIHGGALMIGSRHLSPRSRILRLLRQAGFTVISIDYRLAPETKLEQIIADVRDAFSWIDTHSGELGVDTARMVVSGGSAGGYLTLMTGFAVKPVPRALASFWGYGDIAGDWYSKPDAFYRKQPLVSREQAEASVGSQAITDPPPGNRRFDFYLYCRQQGLWPKEVSGHDPVAEPRWFDAYCPIRNVTLSYPPTILVHGTGDTDVPYALSEAMAAKLAQVGVEHRLITVPNGSHGIGNIPAASQERIHLEAVEFLQKHI
ncbi:MAG: alpha/beta hydrolase [Bryobacterales bacterium]|nr:alpha/beta hydrolase [Bryobacterales bacterium]